MSWSEVLDRRRPSVRPFDGDRAELSWGGSLSAVLPLWGLLIVVGYSAVLAAYLLYGTSPSDSLGNFDVAWYVNIAHYGYHSHPQQLPPGGAFIRLTLFRTAYPPLWPLLIRLGGVFTGGHLLVSAMVLNAGASLSAGLLLHRWVLHPTVTRLGGGPGRDRQATAAVGALYFTPFLGAWMFSAYTESLFVACVLGALLASAERRWVLASLAATCATMTKYIGVSVAVAVAVAWIQALLSRDKTVRPRLRSAALLAVPALAFGLWQVHLRVVTGIWNPGSRALQWNWAQQATDPIHGIVNEAIAITQGSRFSGWYGGGLALREVLSLCVVLALCYWLIRRRAWAVAAYTGMLFFVLSSVSPYAENQRGLLVCVPFALVVARCWVVVAGRSRPAGVGLLTAVAAGQCAVLVFTYYGYFLG